MAQGESKNRVNVKIYGEEYTMKGSVSPDYMAKLAEYVDDRMRLIGSANARLGMNKVAVLAAINLADELFKARRQLQDLETLMDKKSLL